MNRLILIIIVVLQATVVNANKYVHYYINDGSFHGFYASDTSIIRHNDVSNISYIIVNGMEYELPVRLIDKITIEDANLSVDFDGDYRIYEKNYSEGTFHKVIVDNRACLFASKNGDFGTNDTILAVSKYNNSCLLIFTNDLGRINRVLTEKSFYSFIYHDDKVEDIVEFRIDGETIDHFNNSDIHAKNVINKAPAVDFNGFFDNIDNVLEVIDDPLSGLKNLAQNYSELGNDPELHNQFLIVDGVILARDFRSLAASTAALIGSEGLSWLEFIQSLNSFYDSMDSLLTDMFPNSELIKKYEDYYRSKYGINVQATTPSNITCTSANLKGTFSSANGNRGDFKIIFKELLGQESFQEITPSIEATSKNSISLNYSIENLKPNTNYFYYLNYECVVDGLRLTFSSAPIDFKTLTPEATTLGIESKNDKSACVKCYFKNVPEGAICGIQYGTNGSYKVALDSASEEAQLITLSGLQPENTYSYQAFIQYDGEKFYGTMREFTTYSSESPMFEILNYDFFVDVTVPWEDVGERIHPDEVKPSICSDIKINISLDAQPDITYVASCDNIDYPISVNENSVCIKSFDWHCSDLNMPYDYDVETNEFSVYFKRPIHIIGIDSNGSRKEIIYINTDDKASYSTSTSSYITYNIPIKITTYPSVNMNNFTTYINDDGSIITDYDVEVDGFLAYTIAYNCFYHNQSPFSIPGWTEIMYYLIPDRRNESGLLSVFHRFNNNYHYHVHSGFDAFVKIREVDKETLGIYGYDNSKPIYIIRSYSIARRKVCPDLDEYQKDAAPYQEWAIKYHQDYLKYPNGVISSYGGKIVDNIEILDIPGHKN